MTRWPDGIIDPHIHQWDPLSTERVVSKEARLFRRLPRIPRALRWVLPRADREFVGNPHHVLKPYLPLDYRRDAGDVPVEAVVHTSRGRRIGSVVVTDLLRRTSVPLVG